MVTVNLSSRWKQYVNNVEEFLNFPKSWKQQPLLRTKCVLLIYQ